MLRDPRRPRAALDSYARTGGAAGLDRRVAGHRTASLRLASLALLALPLASCGGDDGGAAGAGMRMPPVPVEVAAAEPTTVRDGFTALGTLEARESIEVASEIAGVVLSIPMREGQAVGQGALLIQLEDSEIAAEARRAEALLELARADFERAQKLYADQVISEQELERRTADLRVAEANDALARARHAKTRIRAAFPGVVGKRLVSPGAYVHAGDVLTNLARVDEMRVEFTAPERFTAALEVGAPVEVTTLAYPGERFEGTLTVVSPIIDSQTRTVQLVARVPNRDRRLKPGMSANVTAILEQRDAALVIPSEAVFAEGEDNYVFLVNPDSSVARKPVRLGSRQAANVEVVEGLDGGQLVVRAGHQKLFDGARVMPVQGGPPGAPGAPPGGEASGGGESEEAAEPEGEGGGEG